MSAANHRKCVGHLAGMWRYPVKSMGAEALHDADVSWFGVAGDRRWAFVRDEAIQSDFPWLTIRQRNDMNHYRPSFANPSRPDKSATVVRTPTGSEKDVADPQLADELYPGGARVIRQNRGVFDTFPLSLITTQTITELGNTVGTELNVQRFRPNFLIDAANTSPFQEDTWVGCVLQIGDLRMRVDMRDSRCIVITVDPVTAQQKPEVLRTVASEREGCLGVYATTVEPGRLTLGDKVFIETID